MNLKQTMRSVPNSCNITWSPPEGARSVKLDVIHMDLPNDIHDSGDCPVDRLEITHGTEHIGTFCGECYFTRTTQIEDNSYYGNNKPSNNNNILFNFIVSSSGRYHTGFIIKITGELYSIITPGLLATY